MRQAINLLEKQIESKALEMKILAFDYIRGMGERDIKEKFFKLEERNTALEQAVDELLSLEAE